MENIEVTFSVPNLGGKNVENILSYSLKSSFVSNSTDSLTIKFIPKTEDKPFIKPLGLVSFFIDSRLQFIGRIFTINRDEQGRFQISAKDKIQDVKLADADPRTKINKGETLESAALTILEHVGITEIEPNNNNVRKQMSGIDVSPANIKNPKNIKVEKRAAEANESTMQLLSRYLERNGFLISAGSKINSVVLASPEYNQPASYKIIMKEKTNNENNVMTGSTKSNYENMMSFIIGTGKNKSADLGQQIPGVGFRLGINELFPDLQQQEETIFNNILDQEFFQKGLSKDAEKFYSPMFFHSSESKNEDELRKVLKRETSDIIKNTLVATYKIPGHKLNEKIISKDTMIEINDTVHDLNETLYIENVIHKFDSSGQTTDITCFRPGSFVI